MPQSVTVRTVQYHVYKLKVWGLGTSDLIFSSITLLILCTVVVNSPTYSPSSLGNLSSFAASLLCWTASPAPVPISKLWPYLSCGAVLVGCDIRSSLSHPSPLWSGPPARKPDLFPQEFFATFIISPIPIRRPGPPGVFPSSSEETRSPRRPVSDLPRVSGRV